MADKILGLPVICFFGFFAGGDAALQLPGAAGHPEHGGIGTAKTYHGWFGILAVLPGRIGFDALDRCIAGDAVAAADLHGFAGIGHAGVHIIGIGFGPDPAMHGAHGCSQDQAQVVDTHLLGENGIIRFYHVVIGILRELHMQAVAWFAGFAVADAIGEDDEIFGSVEELTGFEKMAAEQRVDKIMAVAGWCRA